MKQRMFFLPVAGILLAISCSAQKLKENEVPAAVKTAMTKKFPGVNGIKWSKEENDFESEFKKGGKEMSAVFDASGTLKETETEIAVSELPQPIKDWLAQNLKGKKISEAAIIHKPDGSIAYEAEANGTDYEFDSKGKLLKTEKEGKEDDEDH